MVKNSSQSDKRLRRKTRKFCADRQTETNKQTNGPICNTLSFGEGKYKFHLVNKKNKATDAALLNHLNIGNDYRLMRSKLIFNLKPERAGEM